MLWVWKDENKRVEDERKHNLTLAREKKQKVKHQVAFPALSRCACWGGDGDAEWASTPACCGTFPHIRLAHLNQHLVSRTRVVCFACGCPRTHARATDKACADPRRRRADGWNNSSRMQRKRSVPLRCRCRTWCGKRRIWRAR